METTPRTAMPPAEVTLQPKNENIRRIVGIVVALLVLAALIGGVYWSFLNKAPASPFPKEAAVSLSLGYVPASTLFRLDESGTGFSQIRSIGEPEGTIVIDEIQVDGVSYYLILDPSSGATTLYVREGDSLRALTTSTTVKFDLSYDATTNTFVFLSKQLATPEEFLTVRDWDVTVLTTEGEKVIGTGLHAVAGNGGVIVGTFQNQVMWMEYSGAPVLMTEREHAWEFDVNNEKTELAIYNSATKSIDRFDLTKGPKAITLNGSVQIAERPTALAYMGGEVIVASLTPELTSIVFTLAGSDKTTTVPLPNPSVQSAAYNLSITL